MGVRGIRGAITVKEDTSTEILEATEELVHEIIGQNQILPDHVAAIFITVTTDLVSDFPAKAIRKIGGWELVPLMCSTEIPVLESLSKCIRVMMLVNTDLNPDEVNHVFLREAKKLRPDLADINALTSN
ncbi:chorismate mutase [Ammoniphilus sp. YIM 78166]|uniref:chorismate mutase n=1 Tax=Ammoniphilus sp. YIM 78166 TaxID=1644106 RepID=UPI00106F33F3|nr:chorismate mutase [Ammoniphilus sp. YIM 78166]